MRSLSVAPKIGTTESDQPFVFCEKLKMIAADDYNQLIEIANT